jgi:hypothetical protein
MDKHRFRSYLDDGLFVVLIMAAAMASAAMEASAVLGAWPKTDATQLASLDASPAAPAEPQLAGASSVDAPSSAPRRSARPSRASADAQRAALGAGASRAGRRAASD